jgi:eukaryotic-like serine/threonine-protein kinase
MSVIESTVDGRYQIVARIASGGMGEVYRAHDAVLGREVAIKVLHPQYANDRGFIDRFRREARAAAILGHPNIVGVYDWGSTDGTYFMVMEFVRGLNLRALLLEYGRLEPAQVAEVALQVLAALEHAHGHGIVHRDIKPENILIAADGTLKVADFGLARAFAESNVSQAEGTVTGTVQYLAPEQIHGEPADPRTDLYALGVVMFELLTGRPPFSGETAMAIAYKHLSARVPPPSSVVPEVPASLDRVVQHATEKDRELRPASASTLAEEVADAAAFLTPAPSVADLAAQIPSSELVPHERASTVTIPRALSPRAKRRRRWRRVAVVFAVLAVLAGGGWGAWTYAVPHYTRVPNIEGRSVGFASSRLHTAGLKVAFGDPVFSSTVPAGIVIRTTPPPGVRIEKGATVTIVESAGPELLPVPGVKGETEDEAKRRLSEAGFRFDVTRQYSDTAAQGLVIAQSPRSGVKLERGSTVSLTISRGPQPVTIPDVTGQPAGKAFGTLAGLGLEVTRAEEFSVSVPQGDVIRIDPPVGTELPKGSVVTLVVSKGPRTFAMPAVIGLSAQDATAKLEGLGLTVHQIQVPGSIGSTVVGQDPGAGQSVQQGQDVTIYVGG